MVRWLPSCHSCCVWKFAVYRDPNVLALLRFPLSLRLSLNQEWLPLAKCFARDVEMHPDSSSDFGSVRIVSVLFNLIRIRIGSVRFESNRIYSNFIGLIRIGSTWFRSVLVGIGSDWWDRTHSDYTAKWRKHWYIYIIYIVNETVKTATSARTSLKW